MTPRRTIQPAAGTPDRRLLLLDQLDERLASMPQVAAALASHAPLEGAFVRRVRIDGHPADAPADTLPRVSIVYVGPRYFDVTGASVPPGVPPLTGALLDDDAVVVNERFAALFFPDEPVIGRRFWVTPGERWLTIAGVVGDIRQHHLSYLLQEQTLSWDRRAVIYRPYTALAEHPLEIENRLDMGAFMTILARSSASPGAAAVSIVLPATLFGSEGLDPLLLAAVAVVLVAAGLLASALPARRALRVDPMRTLRAE